MLCATDVFYIKKKWRNNCSELYNVMDCDKMVFEFEFQSYYYIPFWTNTIGNVINPRVSSAMTKLAKLFNFKGGFSIK